MSVSQMTILLALASAAAACLALLACAQGHPPEAPARLELRELSIVSPAGEKAIWLGTEVDPEQPGRYRPAIVFFDAGGKPVLHLRVEEAGGAIEVKSSHDESEIHLHHGWEAGLSGRIARDEGNEEFHLGDLDGDGPGVSFSVNSSDAILAVWGDTPGLVLRAHEGGSVMAAAAAAPQLSFVDLHVEGAEFRAGMEATPVKAALGVYRASPSSHPPANLFGQPDSPRAMLEISGDGAREVQRD